MAFIMRPIWVTNTAYTAGTVVNFNGVNYEAINAVNSSTDPSQDAVNWKAVSVTKIQDYNSLVEAIRLEINIPTQPAINNSIPLFVQLAEESFKTRIRSPQQRKRAILTVDNNSRIEVPGDLLEVINLRENALTTSQDSIDLRSRGVIEIKNSNYEEYQRLLRFEEGNEFVGTRDLNAFDSPGYWFDNRYFNLAPNYSMGTEMELVYYAIIPQLGTTVLLTDSDGNPIDMNGVPTSQSGLPQATEIVTRNWFTSAAPQMLLYGAILKAETYLKDDPRIPMWQQAFENAQAETQDMINRFEDNQAHTLFIENTYSSRV